MKNLIDVGMGGFVYWSFGFGLVYGDHPYSTPYYGVGHFFFRPDPKVQGSGELYLRYFSSAYIKKKIVLWNWKIPEEKVIFNGTSS